jgi:hypothetical protein
MANAHKHVPVAICGVFVLAVGDPGAIWGATKLLASKLMTSRRRMIYGTPLGIVVEALSKLLRENQLREGT